MRELLTVLSVVLIGAGGVASAFLLVSAIEDPRAIAPLIAALTVVMLGLLLLILRAILIAVQNSDASLRILAKKQVPSAYQEAVEAGFIHVPSKQRVDLKNKLNG